MSKCRHCGKEVDPEFLFCPYCGKKELATFTYADWYQSRFGEDDFVKDWEKLKKLDAYKFVEAMNRKHPAVTGWTIGMTFTQKVGPEYKHARRTRSYSSVTIDSVQFAFAREREGAYSDLRLFVNEKLLAKSDLPYFGDGVYLDKATCEEVIQVLEDSRHE
jgi:hypothetical protein